MNPKRWLMIVLSFLPLLILACATTQPKMTTDPGTVLPGEQVTFKGNPLALVGAPLSQGNRLPSVPLTDAMTMQDIDLSQQMGSILLLSIGPSLDTPVCEAQTHYLGEQGKRLPASIRRITLSRDTPFAQKRFAQEAKLTDLQYLSDYKEGAFGRSTGLLIDGLMLLARSVILVDRQGVVRYIQVVPELTNLPDMEKAFDKAIELSKES